ncbi:MAG: PEP-CTERM sorting domain-containing protein [Thiobacillaceae bacterium]|nr:PEP-CTERM sorting domain-containing protein [Thiobacillaceae bacterium]
MKKSLLAGAIAATLGAGSAHAFLFSLEGDLNGMGMVVTGLPPLPAPGFTVAFDLSTAYGNSTIWNTGLAGLTPGSSVWSPKLIVDGQIVIHNPSLPATINRTYDYRKAFQGSVTTTLNSLIGLAALPSVLDTSTPSFSGSMTVNYSGVFDDFPLLGISVPTFGSGTLNINFSFVNATDVLTLAITESFSGAGWNGFEAMLDNLDNTIGTNSGTLGAFIWGGKTVTPTGNPANPFNSTGNLRLIPEPATLGLLGLGLLGLATARRRTV